MTCLIAALFWTAAAVASLSTPILPDEVYYYREETGTSVKEVAWRLKKGATFVLTYASPVERHVTTDSERIFWTIRIDTLTAHKIRAIKKGVLERTQGQARSLSLDLYDQWRTMETHHGKWRFTSLTHVVRAFFQALGELEAEGGVAARHSRYCENHRILVEGMQRLDFQPLLAPELQSSIITAFLSPRNTAWSFNAFYDALKSRGFVIYPDKVTDHDTFRIANIGDIHAEDMRHLINAVDDAMASLQGDKNLSDG